MQRVLPEARLVGGVGQELAVRAHRHVADGHELLALGQGVHVEDDLLRGRGRALPARVDRVLLPLLRARVVEVAALAGGHVGVRLLDAREHLVVQLLLERLRRLHDRFRIGELGAQVGLDLGRALVAQPEVVVHQGVAVDLDLVRLLVRDGGPRGSGGGIRRGQDGQAQRGRHGEEMKEWGRIMVPPAASARRGRGYTWRHEQASPGPARIPEILAHHRRRRGLGLGPAGRRDAAGRQHVHGLARAGRPSEAGADPLRRHRPQPRPHQRPGGIRQARRRRARLVLRQGARPRRGLRQAVPGGEAGPQRAGDPRRPADPARGERVHRERARAARGGGDEARQGLHGRQARDDHARAARGGAQGPGGDAAASTPSCTASGWRTAPRRRRATSSRRAPSAR